MEHAGDSNFAIWLLDDTGDRIDLLVNEIGEFAGSTAIGVDDPGSYLLDVSANGPWKVTIEQPRGTTGTPPPLNITGEGQSVSQFISLQSGLTRFDMTHDGDSNFAIWLFKEDGSREDLLVNEIGAFDGSTVIGVDDTGNYILDISANGIWKVTIEQPRGVTGTPPPLNITGVGQSVSQFISLQAGLTRFDMTHDGDSNFAIWLFDEEGRRVELLVNEIGEFDGSTAIGVDQGTYILDISADGNWKVDITQ